MRRQAMSTQDCSTVAPAGLGPGDVALRFGISKTTVYRLLKRDPTFPRPRRVMGALGDPRWDVSELDQWWDVLPRG